MHVMARDNVSVNSGKCDNCSYVGVAISCKCKCNEQHYWCSGCWMHDELNQEAERVHNG